MISWSKMQEDIIEAVVALEGLEWLKQQEDTIRREGDRKFSDALDLSCCSLWTAELWRRQQLQDIQTHYGHDPDYKEMLHDFNRRACAVIYGRGGWNRYMLLGTGELCFSRYHATEEAAERAKKLGFRLF